MPAERLGVAPEEFALVGRHPHHAAAEELDVLALTVHVGSHDGGIGRASPPGTRAFQIVSAVFLFERQQCRFLAAGRAEQLVAVDQRRFAVSPAAGLAAEVLDKVLAPALLAVGRLQTDEIATDAEGVEYIAVHGRRAARPFVDIADLRLAVAMRTAQSSLPVASSQRQTTSSSPR